MPARPGEVSSDAQSDSESELLLQCQRMQEKRPSRRHTKYQCPADFVLCDFRACASTSLESENDCNTELWLIKAPVNFNPDSLSGVRIPTLGLETVRPRSGDQQVYSICSRPVTAGSARLLTTGSQRPGDSLCAPAFSGLINICESYGNCQANQSPLAIPACPAPVIPEGLRQRFQPFGSRTLSKQGTEVQESLAQGHIDLPTAAKRVKLDPEEGNILKKKKKKKKEKHLKLVKDEVVEEEISATESHSLLVTSQDMFQEPATGEEMVVEKKKKKKKSKDREKEEIEDGGKAVETGLGVKEEVLVKTEPLDLACGDVDTLVKKVKKRKKHTME
ncbi:hypothetical protein GJAV_G00059730 [Gymnothorax javanicus]|nr:hypothetical protein GJAV_G00059730 [Gymnothorax javanicus]